MALTGLKVPKFWVPPSNTPLEETGRKVNGLETIFLMIASYRYYRYLLVYLLASLNMLHCYLLAPLETFSVEKQLLVHLLERIILSDCLLLPWTRERMETFLALSHSNHALKVICRFIGKSVVF